MLTCMEAAIRLLYRMKRISRKCALFALFPCVSTIPQERPAMIDVSRFGYPPAGKAWNPEKCTSPYRGYHWIQWLDDNHLVVIFNTSAVCPPGAKDASISGNARVVVLTTAGRLEGERDIPYVADLWESKTPGSGLAIGPEGTILVIVSGVPWEKAPNADGMVRVFTRDLQPVQDIPTETAATTMEYGTFTHFGLHFEGVTVDRKAVVFSEDTGIGKPRQCLLFAGLPLHRDDGCNTDLIDRQRKNYDPDAPYPLSEDVIPTAFLGRSADLSLSTVFFVRDRPICDLAGAFCSGKGTLVVYETRTRKPVFRRKYSVDAALALSPDGRKIASFLHDQVEITPIP
jgi:hypothetical protein